MGNPADGEADEYRLEPLARPLRRRVDRVINVGLVAIVLGLILVILAIEGVRLSILPWAVALGVLAALVAFVVWLARRFTPAERAEVQASQRRFLRPLAADGGPDVVRVPLRRGWWHRRSIDPALLMLVADDAGMQVPRALFERPRPTGDPVVAVPWPLIARWRVQSDSDGPDVYVLDLAEASLGRERCEINRQWITDEVALLDRARRAGLTIELETSITPAD